MPDALRLALCYARGLPAPSGAIKDGDTRPMRAELERAVGLHRAGRRADAEKAYRALLARAPRHPPVLYLLGLCRLEQGDLGEGSRLLRQLLKLAPEHADGHHALGRALLASGQVSQAEKMLKRALKLNPGLTDSQVALGNLEAQRGRPERAEAHYRGALARQPGHAGLWNNLANVLRAQGRDNEALEAWQSALQADPDNAEALCNQAIRIAQMGRVADGIEQMRKAVALKPGQAELHYNLGIWLFFNKRFVEAAEALAEALRIDPEFKKAAVELAHTYQYLCDWDRLDELMPVVEAEVARAREGGECHVSPYFALCFEFDEAARLAVAAAEARAVEARVRRVRETVRFRHRPGPREKLNIGYFCADFRRHPTTYLTRRLYGLHDRDRFTVTGLSISPDDGSPGRRDIIEGCDRFEDLLELDTAAAARRIAELDVDILVDLQGYMGLSRNGVLALRPAPVQVSYLTFLGSLGAPWADYMIVDPVMVPPASEPHYSEALAFLPHCYQVNDDDPPVAADRPMRAEQGLPEDGFVFCSFSAGYKIDRAVFDCWMRILDRTPGAVLWLPRAEERVQENLRAAAEERGISADRLVFAVWAPDKADHMARLPLADLFLDTLHYGAHSSAVDSLWMGTPVLTRKGYAFSSRGAETLLQTLGVPELVAEDLAGYEALAVELAGDRERHAAIRAKIEAQRDRAPLFDTARFARNLERAFAEMWAIYQSGEKPRRIEVTEG